MSAGTAHRWRERVNARLDSLSLRTRLALGVLAGVLQVGAYAPIEVTPLAILSPLLLVLLLRALAPRPAALLGLAYGLGQFGAGISWIYFSLHLFGDAIAPLAAVLTAAFAFGMALYPMLLCHALGRWPRRDIVWYLLLLPAGWVLAEWIRGWFLTGFPWLLLGHSQVESPLAGLLPVLGVYGVSLILAASAGVLAYSMVGRPRHIAVAWLAVACLWISGQALRAHSWTPPVGEPVKVRLVQGNVEQHMKFVAQVLHPSMQLYGRLSLEPGDPDLVIWPETAIPTFYHRVADILQPVADRLARNGVDVAIGVLEYQHSAQRYFNAVRKLNAAEGEPHLYLKRHLVPFGEYMPFRDLLAFLSRFILIPMSDISSGPWQQAPLPLGGALAAVSICYEDAFGEEVITQLPAATFLLNVSNDAWFGNSLAPHQHLQIARVRTLETGRPMARATNNGISALIDADGRILARSPQFEVHVLNGEIQPRSGATPYVQFGNYPVLLIMTLLLIAAVVLGKRP